MIPLRLMAGHLFLTQKELMVFLSIAHAGPDAVIVADVHAIPRFH